ncbi:MAG: zinc ribbon domain-containing protein [Actinomycetota bacterium]
MYVTVQAQTVITTGLTGSFLTRLILGMGMVIAAVVFGWMCYALAKTAGYQSIGFFLLGSLAGPIALGIALLMDEEQYFLVGFLASPLGLVPVILVYLYAKHRRVQTRKYGGPAETYYALDENPLLSPQQHDASPGDRQVYAEPGAGTPVPLTACPECTNATPAEADFCMFCGKPLWGEPEVTG